MRRTKLSPDGPRWPAVVTADGEPRGRDCLDGFGAFAGERGGESAKTRDPGRPARSRYVTAVPGPTPGVRLHDTS